MMTKDEFIESAKQVDSIGNNIGLDVHKFLGWQSSAISFLSQFEPTFNRQIEVIKKTYLHYGIDYSKIQKIHNQLKSAIQLVESNAVKIDSHIEVSINDRLENILKNFRFVANQLRIRHANRSTIEINDEYDVQDLLHALLKIDFTDIRAEEWTPSYACGALRMDFLLKDIDTVIEVKKTRKSLSTKELGEQLIIDIEKYKHHENCKTLYCFVYDPEMFILNPKGIIDDLEENHRGFLKVIIVQ